MFDEYQLITPNQDSNCSTDRYDEKGAYSKELDVDIEEYSTLQKPKFLQNITYSPEINRSQKSSQVEQHETFQQMSPVRVFDTKPISMISSSFCTKNVSPVSSSQRRSKGGSPSMSPKKRGKRRIKENMENEEPCQMSNFNSNNSASCKVSETYLLSSAGSIYNHNVTAQTSQKLDSQGNLMSGPSNHNMEQIEQDIQEDEQYQSENNRVFSISPSKFDRFIKLDPAQYQNPYNPRSKKSSISELPEAKHDLSVVKEASACLEASSIGTKQYNSKTAGALKANEKKAKQFMKKVERVREIKVGSFSSQARQIAKSVTTTAAPKQVQPYSPIENLMKRTDKIKEKSNLRKSQERLEKLPKSNRSSPNASPTKNSSKIKKSKKPHEQSREEKVEKIEKSKTPEGSGAKPRRQKSDRKKSNLKSGRKNDSIISGTASFPITSRIEKDEKQIQQAIFEPQIIEQQQLPQVQLVDEYPTHDKSQTLSEIQNQAMQLIQYEEELKHNLDNMELPQIPNNSVHSNTSGQTQKMLNKYTKILNDVDYKFDQIVQSSNELYPEDFAKQQFQLQCQSVVSEYQSNYFTKVDGEQAFSNGRLETNQSCMLDHQNYYEDEINKMQQDLAELKQSEQDILTYQTQNKLTPRNTEDMSLQTPRDTNTPAHLQSYQEQPVMIEQNQSPSPVKSIKQIISLIPGRNRDQPQTQDDLLSNLREAQDHFEETSNEMSDGYQLIHTCNQASTPLGSPPTKQYHEHQQFDNQALIQPVRVPQLSVQTQILQQDSPVKSSNTSSFRLNLQGINNGSSAGNKGLLCLQKMQSGSTPDTFQNNRVESEESPALFSLQHINTDVSPTLNQIQQIPGSAELPDKIHPYISGGSPDSFQIQPQIVQKQPDLEHQKQKSPQKARRGQRLSPQKSKIASYFDEFNENLVDTQAKCAYQNESPRTGGCETIRTSQSKQGSKQRRSRKNRSKSGAKSSGLVRRSNLSQLTQKQEQLVSQTQCQQSKLEQNEEVEIIKGPTIQENESPSLSPRELQATMWDEKFNVTQSSFQVSQCDKSRLNATDESRSPSPARDLPINMVIPCQGQTQNFKQLQVGQSPVRKVQNFLSFDARNKNLTSLKDQEEMYLKKSQADDNLSNNSRSSMLDQLQGQLKQQESPDHQEDLGLFGSASQQDEQSENKDEDNFLPTTGSTCTAQFNHQVNSLMSIEMSQERSRHIKQISIDNDDIQINNCPPMNHSIVDVKKYSSNESEIQQILKESPNKKKSQPEKMDLDNTDTRNHKNLNPEQHVAQRQESMLDQFTFDYSQENKNKRQNAILQAESLLALQRQAPKIVVQQQKQATNSILNAILEKQDVSDKRSRQTLTDKPSTQQSSHKSGHQRSFYGEEINEKVVQTPQQRYLETAKRLSSCSQTHNRLSKVKSVGRIQSVNSVDQMNFLTSAVKDKMKQKYQQNVSEIVKNESGSRKSQLNKSSNDITPTNFEKRKSLGQTTSQFFKKPEDLRDKSGKQTKIGQGLFQRRTQSGASNNFLNNSRSQIVLPTFDDCSEDDQQVQYENHPKNNFNVPNLNLSTSLKSLRKSVYQPKSGKQVVTSELPSARNTTPKPITQTPSYMNKTKASAQKTNAQRMVKSSQKTNNAVSRTGFNSGYKSNGRSTMGSTTDKSVFQQRTRFTQGAVKQYAPANKYS